MKNLTIGKRIIAGFVVMMVIFAGLGIFAVVQLRTISTLATVTTADCLLAIDNIGAIETVAHENNVYLLKELLTKNEDLRAGFEVQLQTNLQKIAAITIEYQKTQKSPDSRALFAAFDSARSSYETNLNQVIQLVQNEKNQEAMELKQTRVDPFIAITHAEEDRNKKDGDRALAQVQSGSSTTQASMLIGFCVMLVAAVCIVVVLTLSISRALNHIATQLDDGSNQVASAASQVSASSQTLAEGSSEQAASLEETSSSLEEMASMTKRNSENAQKANDLAKQARTAADKGVGDMQTMSSAMEAIKVSSDDIAKIIKTIDEIAFQTNILALNAAVEAARAGEAGMGFAVVADEVRNLAQRSAQAAKETAGKIEGAIAKTAQGVDISSKVALTLNEIVTKARQVDELVAEVAGASREQTQGITQINTAVGQMDKVTQSNAASAEESAAAAAELNAQAATMKESVAQLSRLVGGKNQTSGSGTFATPSHGKEFRMAAPKARRPAPTKGNGNGHSHAAPAMSGKANGRSQIPLEGDFKDF